MSAAAKAVPYHAIPDSFSEALRQGWKIVAERTKLVGTFRCGVATLERGGLRVQVPYVAERGGFYFGTFTVLA